jgi:purine-cytosine permease-like protein
VLVASGAVLVFSVIGLTWVHSSADLARYQRPGGSGGASMLWATFGATLPAFLLISWGAMLAASSPELAEGLATQPLATLAELLPAWYPIPLLLAAGLSLISGAVLTMYSGGFALQAAGLRVPRAIGVVIAGLLATIIGASLLFAGTDAREIMRDIVTTLGVPIAAWAGIFAAEMMIRNRRFNAHSLLNRGGVYPDVRWVNLIGLLAISVVGFGLTSASLAGLEWQGYLFSAMGVSGDDPWATSDIGVLVALLLGVAVPILTAIPEVRRQEDAVAPEP